MAMLGVVMMGLAAAEGPPLPTSEQLHFMDMDTIQFMHFGIDTSWSPPTSYLCVQTLSPSMPPLTSTTPGSVLHAAWDTHSTCERFNVGRSISVVAKCCCCCCCCAHGAR
jgi:hypothetical protein